MSTAAAAAERAADTEPRPVQKSAEAPLSVVSTGRSSSPAEAHANGVRDARSEEPSATEPTSPSSKTPASKSLPPEILGLFNRTDGCRAKDSSTHGQPPQVVQHWSAPSCKWGQCKRKSGLLNRSASSEPNIAGSLSLQEEPASQESSEGDEDHSRLNGGQGAEAPRDHMIAVPLWGPAT